MNRICFTRVKLPYGWLGNMAPFPVTWEEKEYRTTEALFHALRFDDPADRELIRAETSPMAAKFKAKSMADRVKVKPCSEKDVDNMRLVISLKLDQHKELIPQLINTGDAIITEDVTARMNRQGNHLFWGAGLRNGEWIGSNTLGLLWMEERDKRA